MSEGFGGSVRDDRDTSDLFARARDGDQKAWAILIDECYVKVVRVVRRKMDRPLRALYDSTDFANDVFKSLVAKSGRFDFPNLAALRAYLEKAALQKLYDAHRHHHCLKRDLGRACRLGDLAAEDRTCDLPAADPTPSQYAQARETRDRILAGSTGGDRTILELKAQNYSNQEIAAHTGKDLRTVQRFIKRLSDSWFARQRG